MGKLKSAAIKLRKQGNSYREISKKLDISKSTLSYWLKDVKLKPVHQRRLYTKQVRILSKGPKSQKERRAREVKLLVDQAKGSINLPLDGEVFRFFGVGLYWAEGAKGKMMQITNSDPHLILFMVRWLEKVFSVKPNKLRVYLNLYPQQDEAKIKKFWSDLTDIPLVNFGKTFIKPISKNFKKNNLYFGTVRIYVPRSTDLKYKMLGWLEALLQNVDPDVKLVQEKWLILRQTRRPVNLEDTAGPIAQR